MAVKKVWRNAVIPYESFKMGTRGGAVIFQIPSGDFKGWSFARPLLTVRKSFDKEKPGFQISYTVNQQLNEKNDVVDEVCETMVLQKSEKGSDGKFSVTDSMEIPVNTLEDMF